jgi:hypothetical protein
MPDQPRDWDAELAKIDRELAKGGIAPSAGALPAPASSGGVPSERRAAAQVASGARHGTRAGRIAAVARVVLSVALAVSVLFWPYPDRCGLGLAAYLGAVGVVVAGGVWSAVWTWRHRTPKSHILALLLVLWGLGLAAVEVLPRAGYARTDAAHPATWACQ